jgi:hypothetical protein
MPPTTPHIEVEVSAVEPALESPGSVGENFSTFELSETDFLEMGID